MIYIDNLINNKGGLYGRLTGEMKLQPFTLKECEDFFRSRGIEMSRYNIIQAYMTVGGIRSTLIHLILHIVLPRILMRCSSPVKQS